jgi:hypothetical protein
VLAKSVTNLAVFYREVVRIHTVAVNKKIIQFTTDKVMIDRLNINFSSFE